MAKIKVKNPKAPGEFLWLDERDYRPGGRWELFVEDAPAGTPADLPAEVTPSATAPASTRHNDLSAYDVPTVSVSVPRTRRGRG